MHTDSFFSYLKHEKRYSANTIISYKNYISQFFSFLKKTYGVEEVSVVSHMHLRSWMAAMMEEKITARSVNRKISSLRTYFRFLLRKGAVEKDPTVKIVTPKISKRLPVYVEEADTQKLFEEIEFRDGFPGKRDKLILEILYATGMRLSELVNLKESQINRSRGEVKVIGKGNKERIIPVDQKLLGIIEEYISEKKQIALNEFLIVTDEGKKAYPKLVYRVVRKYLEQVTTVDKKSPHTMRHTFATQLLNSGADLNAVKELLGHASLAATQVYTHNSIEKLKDIYKQAHPKA